MIADQVRRVKELFIERYANLFAGGPRTEGLHCIGIGDGAVLVSSTNQETLDLLPDEIEGVPIHKMVRPFARPL
jgi:hypothetical protein